MKKIRINKFFNLVVDKNMFLLMGLSVFWWVFLGNVNIGSSDVFHDRDQDGLTDEEEYMYGTDINNADSDGDGYRDGVEVESGYDPLKAAPGDKIFLKNEISVIQKENRKEEDNLTDEFFEKLATEKGSELSLLNNYYSDPESFDDNSEGFDDLNKLSLTSEELQEFINQTITESESEMDLISEDDIIILDEITGSEKKKEEKEKKEIERYLTQILYVMSVNKPFAIENQSLLPQLGVNYINEISGATQSGQISQLVQLKEKAQKTYEECLVIEVPYNLKNIHIKLLSIIKYLTRDINEEKLIDQQDPMTMALYIGKLQAALVEGENLKNEIEKIINKYEIEIFSDSNLEGIL